MTGLRAGAGAVANEPSPSPPDEGTTDIEGAGGF